MKTQSNRSASGASAGTGVVAFSTGALSPVRAASFVDSRCASMRRASAATTSPASSTSRSPGTTAAAAISTRWPSRITVARGAVIDRNASSAFSARYSWKKPTSAFSTTIVAIATASATSPRNPDTAAAASSSPMSGLASCRASSRQREVRCARWISLAPTSARRRAASSVERPDSSTSVVDSRRGIGRTLRRGVHTARPPDTDCGLSPHRPTPGPPASPYPGARRTSPEGRR